MTVAEFYAEVLATLESMGSHVSINTIPSELAGAHLQTNCAGLGGIRLDRMG